jgi:hypothetical protein
MPLAVASTAVYIQEQDMLLHQACGMCLSHPYRGRAVLNTFSWLFG